MEMRTSQVFDLDAGSAHLRRSVLPWATALLVIAFTTPAFAGRSSCGHAQPATATAARPQAHTGSGGPKASEATPESGAPLSLDQVIGLLLDAGQSKDPRRLDEALAQVQRLIGEHDRRAHEETDPPQAVMGAAGGMCGMKAMSAPMGPGSHEGPQGSTGRQAMPDKHGMEGGRGLQDSPGAPHDGSTEPVTRQIERRDRRSVGGLAVTGEALFLGLACATCHATNGHGAGPALTGVFGRTVMLDDGRVLTVDDRYLRESIVDPAAKVVSGYPPVMPSFRGALTEEQVSALVAYLESLSAPAFTTTGRVSSSSGRRGEVQMKQASRPSC